MMDSEDSRDSSSSDSSKSSENSSESSPSSPSPDVEPKKEEESLENVGEEKSSDGNQFSSKDLPLSDNGSNHIRSPSISDSNSESSDSDKEEDENLSKNNDEVSKESPENFSPFNENTNTNTSRRSSISSTGSIRSLDGQDKTAAHEDLSDVSDFESEKQNSVSKTSSHSGDEDTIASLNKENTNGEDDGEDDDGTSAVIDKKEQNGIAKELTEKENDKGSPPKIKSPAVEIDDFTKTNDEDALDFEAEEGECSEICKDLNKSSDLDEEKKTEKNESKDDGNEEELEEGEVSDEDEKRPEETEPKPVCRFFTRGQCTWGMSCRFLHPGVTDKGNYTMFENMVRSVPVAQTGIGGRGPPGYGSHLLDYHDFRSERPPMLHRSGIHHSINPYGPPQEPRNVLPDGPVVVENAWERGLRTAKEMMRKASKKKEQDIDFDEKKMNMTVSPDDVEKEPFFHKERVSPPNYVYEHEDRYGRAPPPHMGPPYEDIDPYGRSNRYRELPPHRMPHYEDDRRLRPTREVIVQRVETNSRGDEWNDPWMRSKSPGFRGSPRERVDKRQRDHHSYSSNTSYSSSDSSHSGSSSDSSGSSSQEKSRARYKRNLQTSPGYGKKHGGRMIRSPSPSIRRPRQSPGYMPPSLGKKRRLPSASMERRTSPPGYKRKRKSPHLNMKSSYSKKTKGSKRIQTSSSSGSDSSSSSSSDSESESVSSSESSSGGRSPPKKSRAVEKSAHERKTIRGSDSQKKRSPISIEIKKPMTVGTSALLSPSHSASSEREPKKSRREELLKQLRAVEDAIAKKRSKLA